MIKSTRHSEERHPEPEKEKGNPPIIKRGENTSHESIRKGDVRTGQYLMKQKRREYPWWINPYTRANVDERN